MVVAHAKQAGREAGTRSIKKHSVAYMHLALLRKPASGSASHTCIWLCSTALCCSSAASAMALCSCTSFTCSAEAPGGRAAAAAPIAPRAGSWAPRSPAPTPALAAAAAAAAAATATGSTGATAAGAGTWPVRISTTGLFCPGPAAPEGPEPPSGCGLTPAALFASQGGRGLAPG